MVGTVLNVSAIVAGGVAGLVAAKRLPDSFQHRIKLFLGVATIYIGLKTIWDSLSGGVFSWAAQMGIAMAALVIGNIIGKLVKLQVRLNRAGDNAKKAFQSAADKANPSFSEGFVACTLLFCVGPMAIVGALQDGLSGNYRVLAVKAVMDGLATAAFVKTFGPSPILSAVPVLAYQGTLTLGARGLEPVFQNAALIDSINLTGGLLILCISVVILDIAKAPLADYLPSLAVAPLLTWIFD